ncbi:MAG: type II toxin-antitoxin system VapC family toxin [Candidatus Thermoplasmatota archaeon]
MKELVLDTNVFSHRAFCDWLKLGKAKASISAISYTELLYHSLKKGETKEFLNAFLQALHVEVVDYDKEQAEIASNSAIGRWDFKIHARDYMIVSLALKRNCLFVTSNKKDFKWMRPTDIVTPEEVIKI